MLDFSLLIHAFFNKYRDLWLLSYAEIFFKIISSLCSHWHMVSFTELLSYRKLSRTSRSFLFAKLLSANCYPSASSPLLKVFIPPQIQNFAFPCTKLLLRFLFSHFHHCIKSICFQFPGRDTASVLWRNMCFVFTGYWFWHLFISCSALTVHKCFDSKPDPQIYFKPLNV